MISLFPIVAVNEAVIKQKSKSAEQKRIKLDKPVTTDTHLLIYS